MDWRTRTVLLAIILAAVSGGVWLVQSVRHVVRDITDSEIGLQALRSTCRLAASYVERSGYSRWPTSWEDLLDGSAPEEAAAWRSERAELQSYIVVDFSADLKLIQGQSAAQFVAIRSAPGRAQYGGGMESEAFAELLARVKDPQRASQNGRTDTATPTERR
jgi:hypothetical protein